MTRQLNKANVCLSNALVLIFDGLSIEKNSDFMKKAVRTELEMHGVVYSTELKILMS